MGPTYEGLVSCDIHLVEFQLTNSQRLMNLLNHICKTYSLYTVSLSSYTPHFSFYEIYISTSCQETHQATEYYLIQAAVQVGYND